jgi:SAM-dependent methyltransferase
MLSVPAVKAAVPSRCKVVGRRAWLRVSALTNAGSGVSCACCGRDFRKFARFHGEHDQCPGCGALMRHRALALYLRDVLRLPEEGGDLIHAGPGPLGPWLSGLETIRYVSVDIDPVVAEVQADLADLPFPDESFDFALCVHVFEHVPDDRAAAAELYRVLRPGAKALIQVPPSDLAVTREDPSVTDPAERERLFGQYDHVRLCGADYAQRLAEPGFDVARVDYVERLPAAERRLYGLRVGEPFYLCVRPAEAG